MKRKGPPRANGPQVCTLNVVWSLAAAGIWISGTFGPGSSTWAGRGPTGSLRTGFWSGSTASSLGLGSGMAICSVAGPGAGGAWGFETDRAGRRCRSVEPCYGLSAPCRRSGRRRGPGCIATKTRCRRKPLDGPAVPKARGRRPAGRGRCRQVATVRGALPARRVEAPPTPWRPWAGRLGSRPVQGTRPRAPRGSPSRRGLSHHSILLLASSALRLVRLGTNQPARRAHPSPPGRLAVRPPTAAGGFRKALTVRGDGS